MGWVSTMEFVGEIFNVEIVLWFYVWRTSNEVEREKRERERADRGGEEKKWIVHTVTVATIDI